MRPILVTLALFACGETEKEIETETATVEEEPQDADLDGFTSDEDCDDMDSSINPGVDEICDGIDNNCDGVVDEACGEDLPEGTLMGGSSCGQSGGGLAFMIPLFFVVRRRK